MSPAVVQLLLLAVKMAAEYVADVQAGKRVIAETDLKKIKDALHEAQEITTALRPQVDAALDEASKR